jgi:hypothetical protein
MIVEIRITKPPIVGVPVFSECLSGTSSRLSLFIFHSLNFLIVNGVRKKLIRRAERIASTVLKVIYLNTLKAENFA